MPNLGTPEGYGAGGGFTAGPGINISGSVIGSTVVGATSDLTFGDSGTVLPANTEIVTINLDQSGGAGTYGMPADGGDLGNRILIVKDSFEGGSWQTNTPTFTAAGGVLIEDPNAPGTLAASVSGLAVAGAAILWQFDPVQNVWFLLTTLGGGGGITQLTGDVMAGPGSGSQASTLASAQGGLIKFTAGTGNIDVDTTATAPGISQDAAGSGVTPVPLTFTAQVPNAGSSGAAGTPGSYVFNLAAPVGGGSEAFIEIKRAGVLYFALGGLIGGPPSSWQALYMGNGLTPNGSNPILQTTGNNTAAMLNSDFGQCGLGFAGSYFLRGTFSTSEIGFEGGFAVSIGSLAGSYGGGVGAMLAIAPATTAPSAAVPGVLYVDPATHNLMFIGTSGVPRIVALA